MTARVDHERARNAEGPDHDRSGSSYWWARTVPNGRHLLCKFDPAPGGRSPARARLPLPGADCCSCSWSLMSASDVRETAAAQERPPMTRPG